MTRRIGMAEITALLAVALFALWTWLTFDTTVFAALDATSATPAVDPSTTWGQILTAIAVVTAPTVQFVILAGLALWALRRKLSNLAAAASISIVLTFIANWGAKAFFGRPRPDTALPLITAEGWAYPSAHMSAITVLATMVIASLVLVRQRRALVVAAVVSLAAVWWFIVYNRWALRAHYFTDLIAGGFLGGIIASASLLFAGVHVARLPGTTSPGEHEGLRAAMIVNPTKIPDPTIFRRQIEGACAEQGWLEPLWLETEVDDPGQGAARRARKRGVDLVFVAGGDGTVRAVCGALAGTNIPMAILPAGTGNLLARNIGVPLDMAAALDLAFDGRPQPLDLIEITVDDLDPQPSMVIAGMGADATMMGETNTDLKRVVGSAAYVLAAVQAMNSPPFDATVQVDNEPPVQRTPAMCLLMNVGGLQGAISLAPDASATDGLVDVLIASPRGVADWAKMGASVISGATDTDGVERFRATRTVIETSTPVPYQIDGDALGVCTRLSATIKPDAVLVVLPVDA